MTIQNIHNLAVRKGIEGDFRSTQEVDALLARRKKKFDRLSDADKVEFDQESLINPYADSRILHIAYDKKITKALVGIDIDVAEILMAKSLADIDLVVAHHPAGRAFADMHEVMEMQADIFNYYGVPINVAEGLMRERISEVFRGINPRNNWRVVDAARLLGVNLICWHTVADNQAAWFVREAIEAEKPEYVDDVMKVLRGIGEYQEAMKMGSGPRMYAGRLENRCGKVAVSFTGGTEGSAKLYERMAHAGIGTIVGMHVTEDHKREAEAAHLNVLIAGHMSSDSIGMNLICDELEKEGVEIIPCSGFLRVSRVKKE